MGTTIPPCWQAFLNSRTIRSRSAGVASIETRSLSCRLTSQAPISPRRDAISVGRMVRRTASPKGSRPRLPKVPNPKENLCSGLGWYFVLLMDSLFAFAVTLSGLRWIQSRRRRRHLPYQTVFCLLMQILNLVEFLFRFRRLSEGLVQAPELVMSVGQCGIESHSTKKSGLGFFVVFLLHVDRA